MPENEGYAELEMEEDLPEGFDPSDNTGLTSEEAARRLVRYGRNELASKKTSKWMLLGKQFWNPMAILIWIAVIVEGSLMNWADMAILLFLQFLNGGVGFHESAKASDAVEALKASLKPLAIAKRNGKFGNINGGEVVPGDIVLLSSGANVPADCIIIDGTIDVDQSQLTGESLPVTMVKGDKPKMGSTVNRGELEAIVQHTGKNTFFGKTAALINTVENVGHFQIVLLQITKFLFAVSVVLVTISVSYLLSQGHDARDAIAFGVVLLVASIPIAMQVVCTTTMALGSNKLAEQKAIVARLSCIEEIAGMNLLCSDKTGTLTLNKMVLQEDTPVFNEGVSQADVVKMACLAAKWKEPPKDALDTLCLNAYDCDTLDIYEQVEYVPFDPSTKHTKATLKGPDGQLFDCVKGAPQIVLDMCTNKEEIRSKVEAKVTELAERGIRSLSVAVGPDRENLKMFGILTFLDPPRPDTKSTIHNAARLGVDVKMITGDHSVIAKETCRQLEMGAQIFKADGLPTIKISDGIPSDLGEKFGAQIESANGFAEVFPEHKFMIVEAMRQREYTVGMTGDGVNDAPALKVADVGIAVEGATDAARAAADLILTEPGLSVIVDAIGISRCIFQRMKNYVIYRVACTIQLLMFFFITVLSFQPDTFDGACKEYKLKDHNEVCSATTSLPPSFIDSWSHNTNDIYKTCECLYPDPKMNPCSDEGLPFNNPLAGDPLHVDDDLVKKCGGFPCDHYQVAGKESDKLEEFKFYMRNTFHHDNADEWLDNKVCEHDDVWQSTFELPVLTLVIITILNDGTIISIAYDHVVPSPNPEKWTLPVLYMVASLLGLTAMISSIALLYIVLDANRSDTTVGHVFGLSGLDYQQLLTIIYLKISLSDFLTVFSARTIGPFFTRKPGGLLLAAAVVAMLSSSLLSGFWPFPDMKHVDIIPIVFTWCYCIIWWLIQDTLKVIAYKMIFKYDVMGVRSQIEKAAPTLSGNKALVS